MRLRNGHSSRLPLCCSAHRCSCGTQGTRAFDEYESYLNQDGSDQGATDDIDRTMTLLLRRVNCARLALACIAVLGLVMAIAGIVAAVAEFHFNLDFGSNSITSQVQLRRLRGRGSCCRHPGRCRLGNCRAGLGTRHATCSGPTNRTKHIRPGRNIRLRARTTGWAREPFLDPIASTQPSSHCSANRVGIHQPCGAERRRAGLQGTSAVITASGGTDCDRDELGSPVA